MDNTIDFTGEKQKRCEHDFGFPIKKETDDEWGYPLETVDGSRYELLIYRCKECGEATTKKNYIGRDFL